MLPLRPVVVMVVMAVVVMVVAMHCVCGSRLSYPVGRQRVE
jgi:hypothetical protein